MSHLTNTELQEYVDRLLDDQRMEEIAEHLSACVECSSRLSVFQRLEKAIRKIPFERVPAGFTERVTTRLGIRKPVGFVKSVLGNLVPLGAAAAVMAVLAVLSLNEESVQSEMSRQVGQQLATFEQWVGENFPGAVTDAIEWIRTLVRLSAAMPFVELIVGLVSAFVVVALLDEFVFVPMTKKKH